MTNKNIIMCLTTGRSGTQLFAKLLSLAEDTCALHEPAPAFHDALEEVRHNPSAAVDFVRNRKLPDIMSRPGVNYVETSHLFGKGFFEAFIELGVPFRLIVLNRSPRAVAKSIWRIKAIPHRTARGRRFFLDPARDPVLELPGWEKMTDYQLCYWYCLEMERRKSLFSRICRERNIPVVEVNTESLNDWDRFQQLCSELGLRVTPDARVKHAEIASSKVNRKTVYPPRLALIPFAFQERVVWKKLGMVGLSLESEIKGRYGEDMANLRDFFKIVAR